MESPHREAEPGQQEQELRQILNKDKSKRSKSLRVSVAPGTTSLPKEPCPQNQGTWLTEGVRSEWLLEGGSVGSSVVIPRPSSASSWSKGV